MLQKELSKIVSQELLNAASLIWRLAENYPDVELPRRLVAELNIIVDSLNTLQDAFCIPESRNALPRHPKCALGYLDSSDPGPLILPRNIAEDICSSLYEEERRINLLIGKTKESLSRGEQKKFVLLCARIMGNIFAGILSPLWHQYPEISRLNEHAKET